jgi:hypothetical protein
VRYVPGATKRVARPRTAVLLGAALCLALLAWYAACAPAALPAVHFRMRGYDRVHIYEAHGDGVLGGWSIDAVSDDMVTVSERASVITRAGVAVGVLDEYALCTVVFARRVKRSGAAGADPEYVLESGAGRLFEGAVRVDPALVGEWESPEGVIRLCANGDVESGAVTVPRRWGRVMDVLCLYEVDLGAGRMTIGGLMLDASGHVMVNAEGERFERLTKE